MGEALEQAKGKLGLVNKSPGSENTSRDISSLEEVLNTIDNLDARDALRARVREITANANLRATEAEGQLQRLGGANMGDEEKKREEDRRIREEIAATAMILLEKNVDPKIVGQYILGSTPVTPITLSGPGMAPSQGLIIDDVKKIWDMATESKGSGELKEILTALTNKIDAIGKGNQTPLDPIAFAKQQAEQTRAYYETLKSLGMIKEGESSTYKGEPLEVVKETHRHEERMEEITTDRDYKKELTNAVSDIPERIGRGIGRQIEEEGTSSGSSEGLAYIICSEEGCEGTKIIITPETGDQAICPKCGTIYSRRGTVEAKQE